MFSKCQYATFKLHFFEEFSEHSVYMCESFMNCSITTQPPSIPIGGNTEQQLKE